MKSRTLADDDSHLPFLLWPQSNAPPRAPLRNWPELGLYPVGSLLVTAALHPCPHNPPLFHLFLGAPQSQLQESFSRSSCYMTPRHGTVTRLPQAITRLTLGRKPGDVSPGVPCRYGRPGGPTGGRVCTDGVRRVSAPEQKQPADRPVCRSCAGSADTRHHVLQIPIFAGGKIDSIGKTTHSTESLLEGRENNIE